MIRKNNIWEWMQSSGEILKVVSDSEEGTIKVYDSNNNLIMERSNLSRIQIKIIEEHFLKIVAKRLNYTDNLKPTKNDFDPMIV